jgi:beta-lactamase regulating signal transducer with metallopeptidase domain
MFELAADLLLTYLLHSSLLLGAVWLLERCGLLARWGVAEATWRTAVLGAWLTTAVALGWPESRIAPAPAATSDQLSLPAQRAGVTELPRLAFTASVAPDIAVAPAAQPQPQPLKDVRVVLLLTALWLLVAIPALLGLLLQALRLGYQSRRLPAWPDAALQAEAAALSRRHALAAPSLRRSASHSPWAWALLGRGVIGLPAWTATELNTAQRRAVLAHELAHLLRRDPLWRALTQAAAHLGWLQPLNRLALRRLDLLMETACDRWAAEHTGQAQALAESLLHCAEAQHATASPRLAIAMVQSSTPPLLARLRLLLEPPAMPTSPLRHARWWLGGSLLLAAIALPAALLPVGSPWRDAFPHLSEQLGEQFAQLSLLELGNPNSSRIRHRSAGLEQDLHWQGKAVFSDTDDDVLSLEGPLLFRERRGDTQREWSVQPVAAGLQREYRVNGQLMNTPDAEGQTWIAAMVALAVESTVPATTRARQLYQRQGLDGLLQFLAKAGNEHQRVQRISAVLAVLPEAERPADLAERLLGLAQQIDSDFEQRHALQTIGNGLVLSDAQWVLLLKQAEGIGSDFELSELLAALARRLPASADVLAAWSQAVAGIDSDFEQRRAMEAQLQAGAAWLQPVLESAQAISGDFEQRQLLQALVGRAPLDMLPRLAAASTRIGGDFEQRSLLVELLQRPGLDSGTLQAVLAASKDVDGSFERLQVLLALAPQLPADGSLDAGYRQLARGLGTHERGEAEQALDR